MKIVTYSVVLNQHQAPVADVLWELTNHQFVFVELINLGDAKGGTEDYSQRPYLLRAWESDENRNMAMELACTADCCIFSGVDSLPYQKERLKLGLFSFDMSERWLKHGWKSLASPRLLTWLWAYYLGGWKHKPLYKLCMSDFAANDNYSMGTFKGKAYKWGYITKVERNEVEAVSDVSTANTVSFMWCARYLMLKHPELPVLLASELKRRGYQFSLNMYGDGILFVRTQEMIKSLDLTSQVAIHGNVPNDRVREAMAQSDIFLFTSDRYEGWGAVANESLSNGCVLVASDTIGSSPYLINNGENGFMFHSASPSSSFDNPDHLALEDLINKVVYLLEHREELVKMKHNAREYMQELWSPKHAAENLMQLIDDLKNGSDTSIVVGPCSKA